MNFSKHQCLGEDLPVQLLNLQTRMLRFLLFLLRHHLLFQTQWSQKYYLLCKYFSTGYGLRGGSLICSGCDTVSSFRGKGKKAALDLVHKSDLHAATMSLLEVRPVGVAIATPLS